MPWYSAHSVTNEKAIHKKLLIRTIPDFRAGASAYGIKPSPPKRLYIFADLLYLQSAVAYKMKENQKVQVQLGLKIDLLNVQTE